MDTAPPCISQSDHIGLLVTTNSHLTYLTLLI